MQTALPSGIQVFERGWLSSNNILLTDGDEAVLVDSGYCTHVGQTLALLHSALGDKPLHGLFNTHLHSDHCGGNAALQARYPLLQTAIPPGNAPEVAAWDTMGLSFAVTGQLCPRFRFDDILEPGTTRNIAGRSWQIHAAAGHDPHSVILFEPRSGILISADALWEQGFGVVFPELDGVDAFDEVANTLDLIENLNPRCVIPGHGRPFSDVRKALDHARARLRYFTEQPSKHSLHAAKVLLKFKLLELQSCSMAQLLLWAQSTPYFETLRLALFPLQTLPQMVDVLLASLIKSHAASRRLDQIENLD